MNESTEKLDEISNESKNENTSEEYESISPEDSPVNHELDEEIKDLPRIPTPIFKETDEATQQVTKITITGDNSYQTNSPISRTITPLQTFDGQISTNQND
jgi:hypothetical protein